MPTFHPSELIENITDYIDDQNSTSGMQSHLPCHRTIERFRNPCIFSLPLPSPGERTCFIESICESPRTALLARSMGTYAHVFINVSNLQLETVHLAYREIEAFSSLQ